PAIHDPEHGGMVVVGLEGKLLFVQRVVQIGRGEDSGNPARVLDVSHRGAREDPEIGIELVVDLGGVLEIKAVAYRLPAYVALQQNVLGAVEHDPARHRFVDGRVLDVGRVRVRRIVFRLSGVVEVDGIVPDARALAELFELDPLDLDKLEALSDDHVAPEITLGRGDGDARLLGGKWIRG